MVGRSFGKNTVETNEITNLEHGDTTGIVDVEPKLGF